MAPESVAVGPKMTREADSGPEDSEGSPTQLHIGQAWVGVA